MSGPRRSGGGAVGERVFKLLLRLYPAAFRRAYGEEMTEFFLARLARARARRGLAGVIWLWLRVVIDLVATAVAERAAGGARTRRKRKAREPMSSFLSDVRHAARRLWHTPVFTLSAVAILAVGIGLNAAVFHLADTILFRPPPFHEPERVVHIYQDGDDGDPSSASFPAYRDMAAMTDVFAGVAATSPAGATWQAADGPRSVSIEYATASYLPVLGLRPHLGSWFAPEHDVVGGELVAVASHRTWRTQLGADPDVIGRVVRLNNQPVTIIGVGPEEFNGEAGALVTDFWLSISSTPVGGPFRVANLERRQDHWYLVKARLAPGVTLARARAAMDALALSLAEAYPDLNMGRDITVFAHDEVRFHPEFDGGLVTANAALLVLAGLVLLLACSNLANLLLVRGSARRVEMAVRQALGAGRARIARLLLVEALLLAALGGLAGLAVAAWSVRWIPRLPLPIPGGGLDVGFDHRMVVFAGVVTLLTGVVFGFLPALRGAGSSVAAAFREEGPGRSAGRSVSLLRGALVAVQVAVSVVLVVGAGLLVRSLVNAGHVDPGFDADRIVAVSTDLQQGGVSDAQAPVLVTELLDRVQALPGVERAALTTRLPLDAGGTTTQVVDGYTPPTGTGSVELPFATVSPGYFAAMGIRLLEGRAFSRSDTPESAKVIVVNEAAARALWGGDALGGRIRGQGNTDAPWSRVVGVVADAKVNSLGEEPTPMVYYSADQSNPTSFTIVARTAGDPAPLTAALRRTVPEVRATLPVTRLLTLDEQLGGALAGLRTAAALLGGFSLLALLVASLGVYAVVAFAVERRTRELGIRIALGAAPGRLVWTVVAESLAVVGTGLAAGLWLSALATRGLEGMLFGIETMDGPTLAVAATLLLLSAAIAAFLPARRAAAADPLQALRSP